VAAEPRSPIYQFIKKLSLKLFFEFWDKKMVNRKNLVIVL